MTCLEREKKVRDVNGYYARVLPVITAIRYLKTVPVLKILTSIVRVRKEDETGSRQKFYKLQCLRYPQCHFKHYANTKYSLLRDDRRPKTLWRLFFNPFDFSFFGLLLFVKEEARIPFRSISSSSSARKKAFSAFLSISSVAYAKPTFSCKAGVPIPSN